MGARHADMPRPFSTASSTESKKEKKEYTGESFDFVRVILHSVPPKSVERKKAHVIESQVNGGSSNEEKLDFARKLVGTNVPVSAAFSPNETIDLAGVTKGKGFQGPVKRFGVRVMSKKSRKGHRR